MPNHRLVTLLSAVAIATTAGLVVPSPARAADDKYVIKSRWSGMCLQPVGGSMEQGAAIVQQPCAEHGKAGVPIDAQLWSNPSDNPSHLQNSNSGLCLDARGLAVDRTPVQQWPCNNISNENWEWGPTDSNGDRQLISRVSGTRSHCLDIPGAQITEGLEMWIYHCTENNVAQQWEHFFPQGE
jgi:Ricin-type beta-trefoil lectin domain